MTNNDQNVGKYVVGSEQRSDGRYFVFGEILQYAPAPGWYVILDPRARDLPVREKAKYYRHVTPERLKKFELFDDAAAALAVFTEQLTAFIGPRKAVAA